MFIPPQTHGALFRIKWDTPACKVCFRRITSQTDRATVYLCGRARPEKVSSRGFTRIKSGWHSL